MRDSGGRACKGRGGARGRRRPAARAAPERTRRASRRSLPRARSAAPSERPFSSERRSHRLLAVRRAGEPVDGVGREPRRARPRGSRRSPVRELIRSSLRWLPRRRAPGPRGPSSPDAVKPSAWRSAATRPASPSATSRTSAPPSRSTAGAAAAIASVAPSPRAHPGAPSREPPAPRRRSRRAARTAGSRRRGPTGRRGRPARRSHSTKLDLEPGTRRVRASNVERIGGAVDRGHLRPGVLVGDRERDRAASGSHIEHARALATPRRARGNARRRPRSPGGARERAVDGQREPPEPPLPEHVGERLPTFAPRDERVELRERLVRQLSKQVHPQSRTGRSENVRDEELGVDARALDPGRGKSLGSTVEG